MQVDIDTISTINLDSFCCVHIPIDIDTILSISTLRYGELMNSNMANCGRDDVDMKQRKTMSSLLTLNVDRFIFVHINIVIDTISSLNMDSCSCAQL